MNALEDGFYNMVKKVKLWQKKAEEDVTRLNSIENNNKFGKNLTVIFCSNSTIYDIRSRIKLKTKKFRQVSLT